MASGDGRLASTTTARTKKSSTPTASPAASREPSPSRPSAPPVQPTAPKSKTSNGTSTTHPAPVASRQPKPLSLSEAATKLLNPPSSESGAPANTAATSTTTTINGASAPNGSAMRWPTSPRIRSPQSGNNSRRSSASSTPRPSDPESQDPDATPQASSRPVSTATSDQPAKSPVVSPIMLPQAGASKVPRGFVPLASTLETVQEGDNSSPNDSHAFPTPRPAPPEKHPSTITTSSAADGTTDVTDSETDAATIKSQDSLRKEVQTAMLSKKSATAPVQSAPLAKSRAPAADGSSKNMIVETETVASIPQSTGPSASTDRTTSGKKDETGPIRQRPSREMLKPKDRKKRSGQKRPSLVTSQASSKADLFEARVASAAEDDDSDSDETFVYESNAPEPKVRPPRHHSRTPSANSSHSTADRRHPARLTEGQRSVRQKRSMKFASSSQAADDDYGDRDMGSVRSQRNNNNSTNNSSNHAQNGKRTPAQHQQHHQQQQVHGFPSNPAHPQQEHESPFSQASRMRKPASAPGSRHSSNPNTPRSGSPPPYSKTPTKQGTASMFDYGNGLSYTERDPLLGSVRNSRYRPARMPSRHYSDYYSSPRRRRSALRAYWGCCCVCTIMALVLIIAGGFLFATTHPLRNVSIVEIRNVLATEESLMADLTCRAINPNIVPISISDMDVNIFAKSRHVGPDARRTSRVHSQRHVYNRPSNAIHARDSVDDGTDPITDPQTMLLGRIFHFDSAVSYEATPWQKYSQNSTGSVRVDKPGNSTEEDGSERWEKVIQYPFELIVRGVFKYTLPLSSRVVTASVSRTVKVDPGDGDDDKDGDEDGGDGDGGDGGDDGDGNDGDDGDSGDADNANAHQRPFTAQPGLARVYRSRMLGVLDDTL